MGGFGLHTQTILMTMCKLSGVYMLKMMVVVVAIDHLLLVIMNRLQWQLIIVRMLRQSIAVEDTYLLLNLRHSHGPGGNQVGLTDGVRLSVRLLSLGLQLVVWDGLALDVVGLGDLARWMLQG